MKKILTLFACLVFCLNTFAQVVTINVSGKDVNGFDVSLDRIVVHNITRGWVDVSEVTNVRYTYYGLGVDEFSVENNVSVAPNPANGRTFLDVKMSRSEMVNIDVFDITGRKEAVFSYNLEEGNNRLELRLKNIGLHIVKISSANGSKVVKVVNQTEGDENAVLFVGNRSDVTTTREIEKEVWYGDYILVQGYATSCGGKTFDSQAVYKLVTMMDLELVVPFSDAIADCGYGFSVGGGKIVRFSPGNLQYQASTDTWRFAAKQWDFIGASNENISPTYSGWIDLFGWGTGDNPTYHESYYSSFKDWGDYCGLSTPEGTTGTWRTLTREEWSYMAFQRPTPSGLRYVYATVNGICGIIMVPDVWNTTTYQFYIYSRDRGDHDGYSDNIISASTWTSVLEPAGCVFLPGAGSCSYQYYNDRYGNYWSSTPSEDEYAYILDFDDHSIIVDDYYYSRSYRSSVRLVADVK